MTIIFLPQHEARNQSQERHNLQNFFSDQLEKISGHTFLLNNQENTFQTTQNNLLNLNLTLQEHSFYSYN